MRPRSLPGSKPPTKKKPRHYDDGKFLETIQIQGGSPGLFFEADLYLRRVTVGFGIARRKVDPVGSLEWAVFLVNVPGGAVAPIGLWSEYWPPVSAASGPFWNGPFVIATCSSSVAAQAVVDALLDAARMFDPRPDSPLTKDPNP